MMMDPHQMSPMSGGSHMQMHPSNSVPQGQPGMPPMGVSPGMHSNTPPGPSMSMAPMPGGYHSVVTSHHMMNPGGPGPGQYPMGPPGGHPSNMYSMPPYGGPQGPPPPPPPHAGGVRLPHGMDYGPHRVVSHPGAMPPGGGPMMGGPGPQGPHPPHAGVPPGMGGPLPPPTFSCAKCKEGLTENDQPVQCEAHCRQFYHKFCSGLTAEAIYLLRSEPYIEWLCNACERNLGPNNIVFVKRAIPY